MALLGREEGFEDARDRLRAHAIAIVLDVEPHVLPGRQRRKQCRALGTEAQRRRADCDVAAAPHRIARIDHEVDDHALQEAAVHPRHAGIGAGGDDEFDVLPHETREHRRDAPDERVQVEQFGRGALLAAQRQQL